MRSAGIIPKRETLTRPSTLSGHELPKVRGVYSLARGCSEGCGTSASAPWLRLDARELRHLDLAVSPRTSLQNLPSVPSYFHTEFRQTGTLGERGEANQILLW